jgi:hypothetical protein
LYSKHFCLIVSIRVYSLFGPKRDEITGDWRKLRNEELNDMYSSPNIIGVIKSRRRRWPGHVVRMMERKVLYRGLMGET